MTPIIVIGAGLAGLACARRLAAAGAEVLVLEAGDGVGGRVRTDTVDGFLVDRGFQVLLTAYPEARATLDLAALDLQAFTPGAIVRTGGRFHRLIDPWRRPLDALAGAFSPPGTFADRLRLAALRAAVVRGPLDALWARPETTTLARLEAAGFSAAMIDGLFRPWFGGIQLDPTLGASSRMFEFVFRMMAEGDTALPARGMGAIPAQLASALPAGALRLGARVARLAPGRVTLAGGEELAAAAIVVAAEGPEAARLLPGHVAAPASRAVLQLAYAAPESPVGAPLLVLNGDGPADGPMNHLAVLSDVAATYAPAGGALVSVTVLDAGGAGDPTLDAAVRAQLGRWYGEAPVAAWRLLRVDRIAHAQPAQAPPALTPPARAVRLGDGLFVCGDHRDQASLQGALASGRRAAEAVLADVGAGAPA